MAVGLAMPPLMKCPSCGRRFRVKRISRHLLSDERRTETISEPVLVIGARQRYGGTGTPTQVEKAVTTEVETFQSDYECKKCGHKWSEKSTKYQRS